MFSIPEKRLTVCKVGFVIPYFGAFCHVNNELYLGGGRDYPKYFNDFRRISHTAKVTKLKSLPSKKELFPMTYWAQQDAIITLGGAVSSNKYLK